MKKLLISICILILITLTGCQFIKDKLIVKEEPVIEEEKPIEIIKPNAKDIYIPKISGIHYFGKNLWEEGGYTSMEIGDVSLDEINNLYLSLNLVNGQSTTDYTKQSSLIKIPNRPDLYLDQNSGEKKVLSYTEISKILTGKDYLTIAGSSNTDSMKVEAFGISSNSSVWMNQVNEGFTGKAVDMIQTTDGNYIYIGNTLDDNEKYYSKIAKVDTSGKIIWSNDLHFEGTDLWLDQILEVNSDTVLALGHIYEKIGYKLFKIEKGNIVKVIDLNYITEVIKKAEDNNFFIIGVNQKEQVLPFGNISFDAFPKITKVDSELNVIYTFETNEVNHISDFVKMDEKTYFFVGNKGLDTSLMVYFDTGEKLELIKSETYENQGIPDQIIESEKNGHKEYIMTGINLEEVGNVYCKYAWITYLYNLNDTLETIYSNMLNNDGDVRYLIRGEQERRNIALSIAASEGNDQLMYIRYMKSDGLYAFVITGKWDNSQIVTQYLLKLENGAWVVKESFEATELAFDMIKNQYPDVNVKLLPPIEVAEYEIKVLEEEEILGYMALVDPSKAVGDLTYCSYIDEYLVILFEDGTGYMITNPEVESRVISQINVMDYYNLYLINEDRPPYFIFMQD